MFVPVAVDNIAFPESSSLSTLDFIPETFEAFQAYSNYATSSTYTTQSFTTVISDVMRWGMGPNNQILGIAEGAGTIYKWDVNTDTMTTHGTKSAVSLGNIRNVVWDNVTNSWVLCGTNEFVKISCDNLSVSSSISVPANSGVEYAAVVAYGGKAYGLPLNSVGTSTKVAIFDLVNNTSTTSANTIGVGGSGYWGAVLTSVGTIYFLKESGGGANSIYEYNPLTDTGSNFASFTGNTGYGTTNLPNGNVLVPELGVNGTCHIINPVNKNIKTIGSAGFGYQTGVCIAQNGHPMGIKSAATGDNGIWGFNTTTELGYKTQYVVQRPSSDDRGFQDLFSLSDGRLVAMPGLNNSGRLVYYNIMNNPNNNTFSSIGAANPTMTNGKGT